jgi:hypothetical protein
MAYSNNPNLLKARAIAMRLLIAEGLAGFIIFTRLNFASRDAPSVAMGFVAVA